MVTGNNDHTRDARQLVGLMIVGSCILILAGMFAIWRNFQLAGDQSWLSQFSRVAIGIMPPSLRIIVGDQARIMGLPLAADSQAYWYLARAGGVVAYILLWLATCWGIMMSSKVIKGVVSVPVAFALHQYLPILGVVFAALHALVLLGDAYIGFHPGNCSSHLPVPINRSGPAWVCCLSTCLSPSSPVSTSVSGLDRRPGAPFTIHPILARTRVVNPTTH